MTNKRRCNGKLSAFDVAKGVARLVNQGLAPAGLPTRAAPPGYLCRMIFSSKNALLAALLGGALGACQPAANSAAADPVAAAETSLMDRHDTLMARTARLYELRQQLAAPALRANPRTPATVRRLQAADAAMMRWMNQYQAPDSTTPAARRLAYFQTQSQQLALVEKQMQGTIDSASALVKGVGK